MLNQETAKAARTDSGYILRAPRRMRVADAVAQYMRVPMGAGNSVPWDPLVAPYVIEPMNCLASREYDAVIFVGPARTGKTIGLIDGWVIYNVICDPADMLIIQMTEEKAREHSKKRLARTFRVSPEVVSRLSPNKNDNNVYDRTFLAGNYLKIGWPSVNIMSSSDYKCVALTDYDRFPEDIDGEGDAFSLASKRTTTFMSSGMTLVESSPGRDVKDVKWRRTSPHEAPPTTGILSLYNRGDRRRWYWPCPHCGEYFQPCGDVVAGFRDIADPVLASEAAYIQCPSCSGRIMPEQKRELNGRGVWLRDGESINADGSRYGDPRRSRIASFWMEGPAAAYQTLSQLVYKLLTAEQEYETTGSEETLKTVINTDWGWWSVKWSISVMETFHWKVRPDMNVVSEPKVVAVKLGDGYEQRRAAGLNNQLSTYSVTIRVRKCEHPSLKAFLERHGGVRAFQWTPPYDWKPIRVVCRKWSASVGALWVTITADFEQVVA